MTTKALIGYTKALSHGKPFYATELGLDGSTISTMSRREWIRKTGNTKVYMLNLYDDIYKKVNINEWEVVIPKNVEDNNWRNFLIEREYNKAKEFVNAYEELKATGKW